jgi:beta-glucanase (GH16 family)
MPNLRPTPLIIVAVTTVALSAALASSAAAAPSKGSFQLVNPANNKRVSGRFTARAALSKKLAKKAWGVEFWVDGQRIGVDRKAPYSKKIDSRKFANGEHVLRASLLIRKRGSKSYDRQICEYMRSIYLRIANRSAVASISATTSTKLPTAIAGSKKPWHMIFRDEFSGTALDGAKWSDQRDDWLVGGHPYNDREDAWYQASNVSVNGGSLVQTIRKEQVDKYSLTTGMINSNKKFNFKYGYIEARVKVPSCRGCWPVFWTLPEGILWPPEMDLFEYIDTAGPQRRPFMASHWSENGVNQSNLAYFTLPCGTATDYTGKFHTYGFLWTPTKIQPYLDGVPGPTFTGAAVPQLSMYLILTLAVGDGMVPDGTPSMRTDYIRIYQQKQ